MEAKEKSENEVGLILQGYNLKLYMYNKGQNTN